MFLTIMLNWLYFLSYLHTEPFIYVEKNEYSKMDWLPSEAFLFKYLVEFKIYSWFLEEESILKTRDKEGTP